MKAKPTNMSSPATASKFPSSNTSARTKDDEEDIADLISTHRYRLSLTPPRQSSFRVVAILFYELSDDDNDGNDQGRNANPDRHFVVGTNDEPCTISGSLCAERAALLQLRFVPNLRRITKVVIVTDSPQPISPGMLCREFMSSHPAIDPTTLEIVLGSAVCGCCGLDLSGPDVGQSSLDGDFEGQCCSGSAAATEHARHDFRRTRTTLAELYPHPSPYVRLTAAEAEEMGSTYAQRLASTTEKDTLIQQLVSRGRFAADDVVQEDLDRDMHGGFYRSGSAEDELAPSSSQGSADEVLVCIDGDMGEEEEMPMVRRRQRKMYLPKLAAARYLLHLAQKASDRDSRTALHPLQYGAAVLFSDGSTSVAYQKKALEYGCSLDAVNQLAQAIEDKGREPGAPCPVLLAQADQFGVLHAPFAPARAYLSEHGHGNCEIAVHGEPLEKAESGEESSILVSLVAVKDLTPSAPDIWADQGDE